MSEYQMPAGEYYFGDPCYVLDSKWMDLLISTDYLEDYSDTDWITRAGSTLYGDGTFFGMGIMSQFKFTVDSGSIGLVPLTEMCVDAVNVNPLGKRFTMDEPFIFKVIDGRFYINDKLVLDTGVDDLI